MSKSAVNAVALNRHVAFAFGTVKVNVKLPLASVVSIGRKNARGTLESRYEKSFLPDVPPLPDSPLSASVEASSVSALILGSAILVTSSYDPATALTLIETSSSATASISSSDFASARFTERALPYPAVKKCLKRAPNNRCP